MIDPFGYCEDKTGVRPMAGDAHDIDRTGDIGDCGNRAESRVDPRVRDDMRACARFIVQNLGGI
jgi:hypothetical protein